MKKIKGVLLNVNDGSIPHAYEMVYRNYKDFYPLLDCSTFDIVSRKIGDELFDIYCDDEGRLKDNPKPSIIVLDDDGESIVEYIVGNVFIVNHDDEGETVSLTDEQIKKILQESVVVVERNGDRRVIISSAI